jgi:uncharacterized membrane protein YbhN (UPF0104 family)
MFRILLRTLAPLLGVALFGLAVWALYIQLKSNSIDDILGAFGNLPTDRLALAILFTVLGYAILTGYDFLALKYVHHRISYGRIAMAAFIGYSFSNSIGHSFLTGGGVRYRLYSLWGLSAIEVVKVVVFAHVTFYLGMLVLIGGGCLLEPLPISKEVHLPPEFVRGIGIGLLGIVAIYLVWTTTRTRPIRIRQTEFAVPSHGLSILQLIVASLDMAMVAAVLWVLLPAQPDSAAANMSFIGFLGLFMVAQVIGFGSQVPGGLGVFEALMLHVMGDQAGEPEVLAALMIYRLIYYVIPLTLGATWLGLHELSIRRAARSATSNSELR